MRVSNQESDTRYAAVEKNVSAQEVFSQFKRATSSIHQAIAMLSDNLFRRLGTATVLHRDILTVTPDELPRNVGLVITSPPYPNAYEYWVGRSIIHGRTIDNVALLQCATQPYGFVMEGVIGRRIPMHRKTFNPVHGKISQEHLLVFSLQSQT